MKKKTILILILTLLFTACKDESIDLSQESNIVTRAIANTENGISSSSFKLIDNRGYTTFEVECSETSFYYLSAWIEFPIINECLYEYQVAINGVICENTFKPSQAGWQTIFLTDDNNAECQVKLVKGVNTISILSVNRETININQVKVSLTLQDALIDDSAFINLVNEARLNGNMSSRSATVAVQSDEIYSYILDFPTVSTYSLSLSDMEPGQHLTFTTTTDNNFPHYIQLLASSSSLNDSSELNNFSWFAYGTSSATLDVILPDNYWGGYTLIIRSCNPGTTGLTNLTYVERYGSESWTRKYVNNLVAGSTLQVNRSISGYSFLAKYTGTLFPGMSFEEPEIPGKVMRRGDIIQISDISGNYRHQGFHTYTGPVTNCYISGDSKCNVDVYLGLDYSSSSVRSFFPNLLTNNSFKSGLATNKYNCISWSVERTDYWEWPLSYGSNYYNSNPLTAFDNLYSAYGYTRSGATADNAGIALWTLNGEYTHASVTKNANTTKPHGFAWESKCGALERVMHSRDALSGSSYGSITYYYRPISTAKSIVQVASENINLTSINMLNAPLKATIPLAKVANFEKKYSAWKETWTNTQIAIYSDPKKYTQSKEYSELLELCENYGKASWPLFVEKLTNGDILAINLVEDLTFSENKNLMNEVKNSAISTKSAGTQLPSMYSNYVNYCTKLLDKSKTEIQSSINQINK